MAENEGAAGTALAPAPEPEKKPAARRRAAPERQPVEQVTTNILRCSDGKYRWIYNLDLLKNPTIFLLVWKIFACILAGIFVFTTVVDAISWPGEFLASLLNSLRVFGWLFLGMTVLVAISCLIYAAMMGGRYSVLFEMDEDGINHKQMEYQKKKAEQLSALTVLAGLAAGNATTVGVGLNAGRSEMYSDWGSVRRVKCYPRRGLIKVNGVLRRNQVYAAPEDFDFVRDFILSHCANLK